METLTSTKSFSQLAREIKNDWKGINPSAQVYLEALIKMPHTKPNQITNNLIFYFFKYAESYRNEELREELKSYIA